jgi:hypothetical protein
MMDQRSKSNGYSTHLVAVRAISSSKIKTFTSIAPPDSLVLPVVNPLLIWVTVVALPELKLGSIRIHTLTNVKTF